MFGSAVSRLFDPEDLGVTFPLYTAAQARRLRICNELSGHELRRCIVLTQKAHQRTPLILENRAEVEETVAIIQGG